MMIPFAFGIKKALFTSQSNQQQQHVARADDYPYHAYYQPSYDGGWQDQCGMRKVYMVMHCEADSVSNTLTDAGREQAETLGIYLRHLGIKFDEIAIGSVQKCRETWNQIRNYMQIDTNATRIHYSAGISGQKLGYSQPACDPAATNNQDMGDVHILEAHFRRLFYTQGGGSQPGQVYNQLIVADANVIRYFTLRAIQLPVKHWSRYGLYHGSVSSFTVYASQRVTLDEFSCTHAIPGYNLTRAE